MLIIKMLLRITGYTQEELANLLNVSRVSINNWLNQGEIGNNSKQYIADFFQFPVEYFNIPLDSDIEIYKIIFSTIKRNWDNMNINKHLDSSTKIDNILNEIEGSFNYYHQKSNITDLEIIDGLCEGYDPYTGELIESNSFLQRTEVKNILKKMRNSYFHREITYDELNKEQKEMYEKLRKWRSNEARNAQVSPFIIFTNKELINIILTSIQNKEDLLKVKGIGENKYQKYGEDIYTIINENII